MKGYLKTVFLKLFSNGRHFSGYRLVVVTVETYCSRWFLYCKSVITRVKAGIRFPFLYFYEEKAVFDLLILAVLRSFWC